MRRVADGAAAVAQMDAQRVLGVGGATSTAAPLGPAGWAMAAPAIFFFAYFSITVTLFFVGPISYDTANTLQLLGFLAAAYLAFMIGYAVWLRPTAKELATSRLENLAVFKFSKAFRWLFIGCLIIAAGLFVFDLVRIFATYPGSYLELLTRPGSGYQYARKVQELATTGEAPALYRMTQPLATLSVLVTPAKKIYFALGLVSWRQMGVRLRFAYVLVVMLQAFYAILMGRQILFGEMIFQLLVFAIYDLAIKNRPLTSARMAAPPSVRKWWRAGARRSKLLLLGLPAVMGALMIVFLSVRTKGLSATRILGSLQFKGATVNDGWLGLNHLSEGLATGVALITFYLTHGYHGLAQCLQLPFVWTYGLGSSRAFGRYAHQILGTPDMLAQTYPFRNEVDGASALKVWSKAFTWWASDLTFVGTVVLMLVAGFVLLRVWRQLVIKRNPFAFVLLGQLFVGLFMIVANNQLFHTLESIITTVTIIVVYLVTSRLDHRVQPREDPIAVGFISGALNWGGASKMLKAFANTLHERGSQVDIVVSSKVVDASGLHEGITVHAPSTSTGRFSRLMFLARTVPKVGADVWFPFVTSMIINAFPFIAGRMKCGFDRGNLLRLPTSHQTAARWVYPRYQHLCFQSEAAWRQLDYLADADVFVVPNPFLPAGRDPGPRIGPRQKKIVTVSRLSPEKNLDVVIRAFAQSEASTDHVLALYGTGPDEQRLRDLVGSLGMGNQVVFAGSSSNVMVDIADAAIFVLASDNEGMPNALMEAMSLGMACVSTRCMPGGTNALIRDEENGLIVGTGDVGGLQRALDRLVADPELAHRLGESAVEVRKEFSMPEFAARVDAMVDQITQELRYVSA